MKRNTNIIIMKAETLKLTVSIVKYWLKKAEEEENEVMREMKRRENESQ